MPELLEDRYNLRSTIVASQIPPENMYETVKDPTISDAIMDRLLNNSYKIEMKAENSMRGIKQDLANEEANN